MNELSNETIDMVLDLVEESKRSGLFMGTPINSIRVKSLRKDFDGTVVCDIEITEKMVLESLNIPCIFSSSVEIEVGDEK